MNSGVSSFEGIPFSQYCKSWISVQTQLRSGSEGLQARVEGFRAFLGIRFGLSFFRGCFKASLMSSKSIPSTRQMGRTITMRLSQYDPRNGWLFGFPFKITLKRVLNRSKQTNPHGPQQECPFWDPFGCFQKQVAFVLDV